MTISIKTFFDNETATFTYVVTDNATQTAAVIDSVLDYDQNSGRTKTHSADQVIAYIKEKYLSLEWILETHIHADHLTASHYIQEQLGGKIGLGANIKKVLGFWIPIFNTAQDTPLDATQFDKLFVDEEVFKLGNIDVKVLYTPGHTPTCYSYLIEDAVFVGDALFMPDVGTGRTDFPGGSAPDLYDSIQRILSLPDTTRIFTCHDYPPAERSATSLSTVKEQKENNVIINAKISKEEYISLRNKRDEGKPVPKLLFPAIQVNLRAGTFGKPEKNGIQYVKIPINII